MKGSVQQCVKSENGVLRKEALDVFKMVIYISTKGGNDQDHKSPHHYSQV